MKNRVEIETDEFLNNLDKHAEMLIEFQELSKPYLEEIKKALSHITNFAENYEDIDLEEEWYCGYFRVSTTEEKIFRSFLSSGSTGIGKGIENDIIEICQNYEGSEVEW